MTPTRDQKRLARAGAEASDESAWPALAGVGDDVVQEKTGRPWGEWVRALDAADAHLMTHGDIARHVAGSVPGVTAWWAQAVTVGYERIRGLRDVGQRRTASYEASRSRTFPVGVAALYEMFADTRRRKRWLPEGVARVRTATAPKSMRVDWTDGTQVNFHFEQKGTGKSIVALEHVKLASREDLERTRAFWSERLDALKSLLAGK